VDLQSVKYGSNKIIYREGGFLFGKRKPPSLTHPQRKPLGQKTSLDILGMRIREIMIKSAFFMDESARVVLY
jgi:hypothetical protein